MTSASNRAVNREPSSAHGTATCTAPWSGYFTRGSTSTKTRTSPSASASSTSRTRQGGSDPIS